ncbi:unnamed protein product [Cylicocyclus nassatus]|uniref:Uncharacterized protein n=1 Tax=Cylicocyclus nassatus TaxID=53992 RepID=A0AA36MC79_CYLNA|nr:unnamed protein product [Cylicocyclus nassatus]
MAIIARTQALKCYSEKIMLSLVRLLMLMLLLSQVMVGAQNIVCTYAKKQNAKLFCTVECKAKKKCGGDCNKDGFCECSNCP